MGSVFSLTIPANLDVGSQPPLDRRTAVEEVRDDQEAASRHNLSGRILVVEDNRVNQVLMARILERWGLAVTIAEDGRDAVRKALAESFDVILMDIQMPNMNGYDATKALRKKGMTTPVIALTAGAMKGDGRKCLAAGCNAYLAKPIDRKQLYETLARYLRSDSSESSQEVAVCGASASPGDKPMPTV